MHKATTMKHGSHNLHDRMLSLRHHIDEHLHSRHFWTGVLLTLLILGFIATLLILAANAPVMFPRGVPYAPYAV